MFAAEEANVKSKIQTAGKLMMSLAGMFITNHAEKCRSRLALSPLELVYLFQCLHLIDDCKVDFLITIEVSVIAWLRCCYRRCLVKPNENRNGVAGLAHSLFQECFYLIWWAFPPSPLMIGD